MKKCVVDRSLPKNLPLFLKQRVGQIGDSYLQAAKNKDGKYVFYTYNQVYEEILSFALALRDLGIKRGDNIAMISDNRREWLITDFAIQTLGAADVPRGCDSMGTEIRFIISFADCTAGFFENEKQILKVLENISEVPLLKKVFFYEHISSDTEKLLEAYKIDYYYFDELLAKYKAYYYEHSEVVEEIMEAEMEATDIDDVCTIIFTSGTTGTPKGVMLTHRNYMSQLSVAGNYMPGKPNEWWMSILPVWHSFERLAQYVAILVYNGLAYSKPVARTLLADMATLKPHRMCGVPRLWEALVNGVNQTMQKKGGISYKLYKFFMQVGIDYADAKDKVIENIFSGTKRNRVLDFLTGIFPFIFLSPLRLLGEVLVFSKIKERFGGQFAFAVSGGGALQQDTDNFFRAIGLPMLNGYGMTETAPAIAFRDYKHPQANCIGDVFPTVEIKIVKEDQGKIASSEPLEAGQKGLILVRGDHIMKGYYKRPDLTASIIDNEGWLNTGDIGLLSPKNEINITGRAKDTIVLLDGENIEPVLLEQALCSSEFIESAMVVGQDKKYLSSLIVPCEAAIVNYAKNHGIIYSSYEKLLEHDLIKKLISDLVDTLVSVKQGFRTCERISRFHLISKSFEVGKELSAKLEMMRFKINQEYHAEIEQMYI